MAAEQHANDVFTTVNQGGGIAGGTPGDAVTFTVTDGSKMPAAGDFRLRVNDAGNPLGNPEIIKITSRSGNDVTGVRGAESVNGVTAAPAHANGSDVSLIWTWGQQQAFRPLPIFIVRDEKAANTSGGTFTSGARRTRVLNTEVVDAAGRVAVASNQMTVEAGTYRWRIRCPAFQVGRHKAWLYNVTDSADLLVGSSGYSNPGVTPDLSDSWIIGRTVLAAQKVLEVQHRCETTSATFGFGVESNYASAEVYTEVFAEVEA